MSNSSKTKKSTTVGILVLFVSFERFWLNSIPNFNNSGLNNVNSALKGKACQIIYLNQKKIPWGRVHHCICEAKTKNPIFENKQFSRHFVLGKNNFLFFWKKMFFLNVFSKKCSNLLWAENFGNFQKKSFWKKISKKKHCSSKKKENVFFFKKTKFLFIGINNYFCLKQSVC